MFVLLFNWDLLLLMVTIALVLVWCGFLFLVTWLYVHWMIRRLRG